MKIAAFNSGLPIVLSRYPNGGWTVEQKGAEAGLMNERLGAYSSAEDMLEALSEALVSDKESSDG